MEEGIQPLSLRLYDVLEGVGASEEMRQFYRQNILAEIIKSVDYIICTKIPVSCYHFGSFTEGTTVPDMGSDIDNLYGFAQFPVHADISTSPDGHSYLLVHEDWSYPGYVKLQLVINRQPVYYERLNEAHAIDGCGRVCLKSVPYQSIAGVRHGPSNAIHFESGASYDRVWALRCVTVPDFTKKWTSRCQRNGWPPQQMIGRMSEMSCFVVGVGHESSPEGHIQWRLSFSLHERELMLHLNPVQHKCYILMKMIKTDVVQPMVGEEILTSYHCKTILFHVIENNPRDIWRPDNLIQCTMLCFLYLYRAVDAAFCPMFFLYETNLFDRENFRRQRQTLLRVLESILQQNCQIIPQITCSNVGDSFIHQRILPTAVSSSKYGLYLHTICDIYIFRKSICQLFCQSNGLIEGILKLYNILRYLTNMRNMIDHSEQQTTEALTLIIPHIHHRLAISLAAYAVESRDDQKKERLLRLFERHFKYVQHVDVMAATLTYVTVMFNIGEYELCRAILEENDLSVSFENLIPFSSCNITRYTFVKDELLKKIGSNNVSQHCFMTTFTVTCIEFMPSEHAIVHPALKLEMVRSKQTIPGSRDEENDYWFDWAVVDGKVYFYFLQYLVYTKLNKPVHKKAAMDNLKCLIGDDKNLNHLETAYNLLGWMYKEENRVEEALGCWERSWEIRPHHNAAKWHYTLLMMNRGHNALT